MVDYQPRLPAIQVIGSCLSMITSKQYGTVQDTKRKKYKYTAIKQYGITALAGVQNTKWKKYKKNTIKKYGIAAHARSMEYKMPKNTNAISPNINYHRTDREYKILSLKLLLCDVGG